VLSRGDGPGESAADYLHDADSTTVRTKLAPGVPNRGRARGEADPARLRVRHDGFRLRLLELHDLDELRTYPGAWLVEALGFAGERGLRRVERRRRRGRGAAAQDHLQARLP
jgi:hypothetical protein